MQKYMRFSRPKVHSPQNTNSTQNAKSPLNLHLPQTFHSRAQRQKPLFTLTSTIFLIILIGLSIALTSCETTNNDSTEVMEDEYQYTINIVLDATMEQAMSDLLGSLNNYNENFIPEEYNFLTEQRMVVPGLDRLMKEWAQEATDHILPYYDVFVSYLNQIVHSIQIEDPQALILESDSSISDFLVRNKGEEISKAIADGIKSLDASLWNQLAVQYNSWANNRKILYGEEHPLVKTNLTQDQIVTMFSTHLTGSVFYYIRRAEVLFRTTPNASMDPIAARILGLN